MENVLDKRIVQSRAALDTFLPQNFILENKQNVQKKRRRVSDILEK